jgi:hypothetical protein
MLCHSGTDSVTVVLISADWLQSQGGGAAYNITPYVFGGEPLWWQYWSTYYFGRRCWFGTSNEASSSVDSGFIDGDVEKRFQD